MQIGEQHFAVHQDECEDRDFFPYKDKGELPEEQANVEYHLKCTQCEATYIGKTKQILIHRLKEHDKGRCFSMP